MILPKSIFTLVNHCGLFISESGIQLIEVDARKTIRIQGEIKSQTPIYHSDDVDTNLLSQLLKDLRAKTKTTATYAVVSFPEKIAYSHEHILPAVQIDDIQEAVGWQIGSIFPFPSDEIYYDWKLIERSADKTRIVVVAVSKKMIDGLTQALETADFKPLSFEPSASVLSRALAQHKATDHIIMEIDSFGTSATLIQRHVAALTSTTHFLSSADPQTVFDMIVASVRGMTEHAYKDVLPTDFHMYVTGEKASDQIADLLASKIQIPTTLLPLTDVSPVYHVPYLAAASTIEPPMSESTINLLPQSVQSEFQLEVEKIQANRALIIGLIPAVLALVVALFIYIYTASQLMTLKRQPASAAPIVSTDKSINVPDLLQKSQKVTRLQPANKPPIQAMEILVNNQVDGIEVKHISVDMSKMVVTVSVTGNDRSVFMDFKSKLEASKLFTDVTIPLAALAADGQTDAAITMKLKP